MSEAMLLADAHLKVSKAIKACNEAANAALAEIAAFRKKRAEEILAVDVTRLQQLVWDLTEARETLATANAEYEALKRRPD